MSGDGELLVGGDFLTLDGALRPYLGRLATSCPPAVVDLGGGCPSSGGANTLTATSLPWFVTTFTARATGLPLDGLAVAVTGWTTQTLPLPALLPQGQPGCTLLVGDDILQLLVPVGGETATALPIPFAAGLIGNTFYHQIVPFEIDGGGTIQAVTATNALQLTIGMF